MRFLLVSDTHGDRANLALVLAKLAPAVDGILHCGDGVGDVGQVLHQLGLRAMVYLVRGNVDSSPGVPLTRSVRVAERKLLVAHGHHFLNGDSCNLLLAEAVRQRACCFCFGHTHIPFVHQFDGVLLINPGSLARPRGSWGPSFAVMEVPEKKGAWIEVKFYEVSRRGDGVRFAAFKP
ncbi:MAG: hypothetical protein A2087_11990 [Spirochaetes bacterium GWD1_61_31]|nr:MAG: hypothetical protein A2Y37_07110 [Spirochaetes bacterium GWB1_60_80]OHD30840.1 MAG: hypothetical protein A2004_04635 [Spirochaetes bacterium GWC1_61_12]OHD37391.1 MAG: hypothetical protein A2087_11990 [Spirochaetes bacterium GWD1_61_31]OHD46339.1 MAG: hypothetical protein A2Y35_07385 [Spirochaetes bacterium GWE1_60_18]OHD60947.1 MAG: hypothetical protein A2Y32_12130 [Spirochaetes bacterium GWF1_60_12]HAP42795.1 YfcE family phosphodiesterase [Spirochaetaceae bacterium]